MSKRKIIQVAIASDPEGIETVVALCNDDTLWSNYLHRDEWIQIAPIPEVNEEETNAHKD